MNALEKLRARSSSTAFHLRARRLNMPVLLVVAILTTAATVAARSLPGGPPAAAAAAPAPPGPPAAPPADVPFLVTGLVEGVPPTLPCDQPVVLRYDDNGAPYEAGQMLSEAASWLAMAARRPVVFETGPSEWNLAPRSGRIELRVMWAPAIDGKPELLGLGGPLITDGKILAGQVVLAASTAWPTTDLAGGELGIVLHEAGHALFNLAHSPDPSRQMFAAAQRDRPPGFTEEEKQAIAWVASSTCQGLRA